ncbi:MAG: manganese efflux pump MntP family protein [Polyangiaceae bacterium]|nr:manganese efflux pump MntP family protein [Polyangiaceae bacterium]
MALLELVGLSIGLAMDSVAVAAAQSVAAPRLLGRDVLRLSLTFGAAHMFMPSLGWLAGARLVSFISTWDHWVAFSLLVGLGLKMTIEARTSHAEASPGEAPAARAVPFAWATLGPLAFATSLDALAAGLTLPMLGVGFAVSIVCIGLTNAALSALGAYAGRRLGEGFGPRLEAFGGLVLIGLGVKTLIEHLSAG